MDPSISAQDVVRCDLCEDAIVQMYCDFCHVNLCISCIGKHISDDYDKHKVVPFQQRKSTLIYPKCTTHETKSCEFNCKECNISVCSLCTTMSDVHKGHSVSTLFDLYSSKRDVIAKDTEELENVISPTYEEIKTELEIHIANLDGEYDKLTMLVSKHGEEWHREINSIVDKMKAEIEEIKIKHKSILKRHLDEVKHLQNLIEETLINLSRIEESNKVSMTMEYISKNKELSKLPPKVQVSLSTFCPRTINTGDFYKLFGSLTPLSITKEENGYKLMKPETSIKELLKEPKLITSIQTGYKTLRSVQCNTDEKIWTSARDTNMKCFNIQGSILKTIVTKNVPYAIGLTRNGDLVYSDGTTRTVNRLRNEQTEEVIRLQGWIPFNLCITSCGDLLVTMYSDDKTESKVVRYSGSTKTQTIQFDDDGKPVYSGNSKMKYLTENKNLDICVADWGACTVVVVNQTGHVRFRYTGHPSATKYRSFQPSGITTDSQSQILTADFNNHCIHVLDKDGQFLCYVDKCDLNDPYGLCVDKNDDLFVAEYYTGNVKKIKYLE